MKKKKNRSIGTLIAISGTVIAVFVAFAVWFLRSLPVRLEDDSIQSFRVGGHQVEIETRSISNSGEDGEAVIVVSAGGDQTRLKSSFDYDLWNNYPPGYTSLQFVDDHFGRDLLIWRRGGAGLSATEYVSTGDGKLHTLAVPVKERWWEWMAD